MKLAVCLFALLFCTHASAQALTEEESVVVSNLTALRMAQDNCTGSYTFNKDKIAYLVKKLGVNIDDKKHRPEMIRQKKIISGYYKEIGPKFCDYYYNELKKMHSESIMTKR